MSMANVSDQDALLCTDAQVPQRTLPGPSRKLALLFGAIALVAVWCTADERTVPQLSARSIMSAAVKTGFKDTCKELFFRMEWPHVVEEVNWDGPCAKLDTKNTDTERECARLLVGKYVGDYFDVFIEENQEDPETDEAKKEARVGDKVFPKSNAELQRWKQRVQARMLEFSKQYHKMDVEDEPKPVLIVNALKAPSAFQEKICKVIRAERPTEAFHVKKCRPNFSPFASFEKVLTTQLPDKEPHHENKVEDIPPHFPATLDASKNLTWSQCRSFLRHLSSHDWVEASLAVLDFRTCMQSGGRGQTRLSRSWVRDCIPSDSIGYPGSVFDFLAKYGAPGEDCIPDYGALDTGHCPSVCENGDSLGEHLKRPVGDYKVVYEGDWKKPDELKNLGEKLHNWARQHIYTDGPIVGLIVPTAELASCAPDGKIVYEGGCSDDTSSFIVDEKKKIGVLHSVVVTGWGSEGKVDYYRVMSTFQRDGVEARIAPCAVKAFIAPLPKDDAVRTKKGSSMCHKPASFCRNLPDRDADDWTLPYTDTEDCDGDGVMDHWCYSAEPSYEAFISSASNCSIVERKCQRSVLPGSSFACQRPLGWCMNGERYRRDLDCDGDGNFDHACFWNMTGGYIASGQECTDTYPERKKCE